MFKRIDNKLYWKYQTQMLCIEPWGKHSLRVRCTMSSKFSEANWALEVQEDPESYICITKEMASITNGNITAKIDQGGALVFYNQKNEVLIKEYWRTRKCGETWSALDIFAREFKNISGEDYELTARFEPNQGEKLYGMGQYQHTELDLKGMSLELSQRNSQASVPFLMSNKGYGLLWNNPAIGQVHFAKNVTQFTAVSTKELDYWITADDSPALIEQNYVNVTGKVPMMPEYAMGFWQCKLRYQTQEELMNVAREYYRRKLPISVIVIDYFHWEKSGDWDFDPEFWPDIESMTQELHDMGIKLMVSVWPIVEEESVNFYAMNERGLLVSSDQGYNVSRVDHGVTSVFYDATNPEARSFVWDVAKKNYFDKGVDLFWLDEAEPEYSLYDFDNYRYHLGAANQVSNYYPVTFAQTFYDGMKEAGIEHPLNLIRCVWAGSQKFGALQWSGDIYSDFAVFKRQVQAGLNMAIAGIPWWTTDIGGFDGGDIHDPTFKELLVRWFQYACFCPVMRLHGNRMPYGLPLTGTGGGKERSGADNEVWSYGEAVYNMLVPYMHLRERLKPYITELMKEAHEVGNPPMRPMFYDFPEDDLAWACEEQYMFGSDLLVVPVTSEGATHKEVYLPKGHVWKEVYTGEVYEGGQKVTAKAPIEVIPVFVRDDSEIIKVFK